MVGMAQEPDTLLAPISSMYVASIVLAALNDGLTVRDNENKYQPRLAEQTPSLENGLAKITKTADGKDQLTVTWKLRANAKFTNGDPVTAEDIRYSWEFNQNKDIPIVGRVTGSRYQDVKVVDQRTAEVIYKPGELDPLYYSYCCTIFSKKVYSAIDPKKIKDDPIVRKPVYAGAYTVKEWQPGASITLEANKDYYLGAPKTKTIIFKIIADTNTMLAQARAGQVDVITEDALGLDQTPELDKLEAETDMKPIYTPSATWEHIDLNLRDPKDLTKPHPILGDLKVRQAIAHAVDKEKITKQILYGKTKPLSTFIFPPSWAAAADADITVYKFDQAKAKSLLDEAGWKVGADGVREKGGAKLELKLQTTSGNKMREQTTQVMAADLKAVGFKINLDLLPAAKYFATRGEGPLSSGTFDLGLYAWVGGEDPSGNRTLYGCEEIAIPTKANNFSGQNYPGWCNQEASKLLIDASNKLTQAERKPLYVQAQKIWTSELPVLPLYQRLNQTVVKKALSPFSPAPTNTPPTWNAHLWQLPEK